MVTYVTFFGAVGALGRGGGGFLPATGLGGLGLDGRALPPTGCLTGGGLGLFGGEGLLDWAAAGAGFSESRLASSCLYMPPIWPSALSRLL